jgi:hypothetical protein
MRATFLPVLAAALAACASPQDRGSCGTSPDCPAGQYCARTADGNVCWPDAVAPVVSGVTVTCPAPCLRDSSLQVVATITDDAEVLDAQVTLGLGGPPVAMRRAGAVFTANVDLAAQPFELFDTDLVVTVVARDGARNAVSAGAAPQHVTRLRWTYDGGAPMTSPAVMSDGTVVVGLTKTSSQVLAVNADGTKRWEVTAGTGVISAAPAIGERAIWIGSEDFNLYAVKLDGSGLLSNVGVNTFGQIKGGVAVLSGANEEWAFVAAGNGYVGVTSSVASDRYYLSTSSKFTTAPVVSADGRIHAATDTIAATLLTFTFKQDTTLLQASSSATAGMYVSVPTAMDAGGNVWTCSQDASVWRTTVLDASAVSTTIATLADAAADSPIILANGDVVVGDQSGKLHRISPAGAAMWSTEPVLGGSVLAPMALTGGSARFIVPNDAGSIFAVRDDGTVAWSKELDGTVLRAGNIYTSSPTATLSTAYLTGSNGKLYAVIVDGKLDGAAPWPKAFHDPANTNRAGAQPW